MGDIIKDPKINVLVVGHCGLAGLAFLQKVGEDVWNIMKVPPSRSPAVPKGGKPHIITER